MTCSSPPKRLVFTGTYVSGAASILPHKISAGETPMGCLGVFLISCRTRFKASGHFNPVGLQTLTNFSFFHSFIPLGQKMQDDVECKAS